MSVILFLSFLLQLKNPIQTFSKEELLGKFDPSKQSGFLRIEKSYTDKEGIFLRSEVYAAFIKMHKAAKKDGIQLKIISATRNFNHQKGIWEGKWEKEKYNDWTAENKARDIMTYSSMPGTSRHHWGTDMDFNSLTSSWFKNGDGKKLFDWLNLHASEYGFYQAYTSKTLGRSGYEEEAWHWSYMPTAKEMLKAYNSQIALSDLNGFKGCEAAENLKVIDLYVNGINPILK